MTSYRCPVGTNLPGFVPPIGSAVRRPTILGKLGSWRYLGPLAFEMHESNRDYRLPHGGLMAHQSPPKGKNPLVQKAPLPVVLVNLVLPALGTWVRADVWIDLAEFGGRFPAWRSL
jgi:hypothetical protein